MNLEQAEKNLIFKCIAGSRAYGTNLPTSDIDYRGVFCIPATHYLRLDHAVDQVSDTKNDWTYYALKRFLHLAADANPNILELLFMPDDCVLVTTPIWDEILAIREMFISKRVLTTYVGYAVAQIKKARGQNKLIHNPMPKEKPVKEDFCWIVPMTARIEDGFTTVSEGSILPMYPFRPQSLVKDTPSVNLSLYRVSAVEHCRDMYRLYYYGAGGKGVFRGDDTLTCESIPIDEEIDKFAGILIYNQDAYERELKLWNQYWEWVSKRNNARWVDQESGALNYDAKNISHCLRLLYEGQHILEHGYPRVRFEGEQLQKLKDVRAGKYPYEELIEEAESLREMLDNARSTCSLPASANLKVISTLSEKIHLEWGK